MLRHVDERDVTPEIPLMSVSKFRGVIRRSEISDDEGRADDISNYKTCKPNDLVINRMAAYQGALGIANEFGAISPDYMVLRNSGDFDPSYLGFFFKSHWMHSQMSSLVKGIGSIESNSARTPRLSWTDLKELDVHVPPLDEQKAIADFLDRELAQIDALIEKQEVFEIVSQQRINASILIAVTGNGALAFDPSSSEIWTGDLPSDWNVRKLSHLFGSIGSGTTPTSDTAEYYGGTVPWVTTGELRETTILETSRYVTDKAIKDFSALKLHPKGSLVIAMYGATVGRLGFLGMDATVNQACCVMSKPLSVDIEYVYFVLQGLREVLVSLATGGGQPNISQGLLKSFTIPVPPHQEQIEIRELLEIEMKQHNALQDTNGRILATLRERRQSLISAAVTGKIDVRKAA